MSKKKTKNKNKNKNKRERCSILCMMQSDEDISYHKLGLPHCDNHAWLQFDRSGDRYSIYLGAIQRIRIL